MTVYATCDRCEAEFPVSHTIEDCDEALAERLSEDMPDYETDRDRQYDAEEREPGLD